MIWKASIVAFSFPLHWVESSPAGQQFQKMNTIKNRSNATRESKSAIVVLNVFNGINWFTSTYLLFFRVIDSPNSWKKIRFSLLIPVSSSSESIGTSIARTCIVTKTRMQQSYFSCPLLSLLSLVSASLENSLQRQSKTLCVGDPKSVPENCT